MLTLALLFTLCFSVCFAQVDFTVSAASSSQDTRTYRSLTVVGTPQSGYSVVGTKATVDRTSNGVGATYEKGQFSYNPQSSSGISFYFGVLDLTASYNNASNIGSISGALGEIAALVGSIFLYSNNDGKPGFQLNLPNDPWDCNNANKHDCIVQVVPIANLGWSDITVSSQNCPSSGGASTVNYVANCMVYQLTSTASIGTTGTGSMTVSLYLASQPVMVTSSNGGSAFLVGPDGGEWELTITYPYADPALAAPNSAANVNLGVIMYGAGKYVAGQYSGQQTSVNGDPAFRFSGSSSRVTHVSWSPSASVTTASGTTTGPVYVTSATGDDITNLSLTGWTPTGLIYVAILKVDIAFLKDFGWQTVVALYSWDAESPTTVYWDPTVGYTTSPSTILSAPLAFILMMLVALFYANKH